MGCSISVHPAFGGSADATDGFRKIDAEAVQDLLGLISPEREVGDVCLDHTLNEFMVIFLGNGQAIGKQFPQELCDCSKLKVLNHFCGYCEESGGFVAPGQNLPLPSVVCARRLARQNATPYFFAKVRM